MSLLFIGILLCSSVSAQPRYATTLNEKPLRIAVASNFAPTLKKLLASNTCQQKNFFKQGVVKQEFVKQQFVKPQLIVASTGTLFLQLKHGAAFDIFLSADSERPQLLSDAGIAIKDSQHTYAYGQLALWSAKPATNIFASDLVTTLKNNTDRLAIANPKIAPYGKAAKQVLENLQLWHQYQARLIQGINIGQTFQQTRTQAVNLGIVSNSQLVLNNLTGLLIPLHLHQPIKQQLVILKRSEKIAQAQNFVEFLLSAPSQQFISESGYASSSSAQPADEAM
jgi:molybdate transport system substrate-binding protein